MIQFKRLFKLGEKEVLKLFEYDEDIITAPQWVPFGDFGPHWDSLQFLVPIFFHIPNFSISDYSVNNSPPFFSFYCPQSFSGGGLYLKVKWLLWSMYDGLLWCVCNRLLWYIGHTSMSQFHTGLGRFLAVAGYYRKWWCINKLIIKFIIELGIWVIRACAVSHTEFVTFFDSGWLL